MNILLTNDDGYTSAGLMLLCEKLSCLGHNVYVVAPATQRSAYAHAVHFYKDITFNKLQAYCGAKEAYISSGTPVDCVKFALHQLDTKLDLVISGPNNGENYGECIIYSGTVGAAEEGALNGVKSIALSRLHRGDNYSSTVQYLANNLTKLYDSCYKGGVINVNVPDLPLDQIKGTKVCKASTNQLFNDFMVHLHDDVWQIDGDILEETDTQTDVYFARQGYVTVTPLTVARTDYAMIQKLKDLEQ